MKRVTKIIIGSVIVAATAGGIAYAKSSCGMHGPQQMARHLDLSDEQQKNFEVMIQEFRSTRQEMKQNRKQGRDEMLALLNADKLDQSKAQALVEGKTSAVRNKSPEIITAIANFTDSLSPEQRQQLRERITDRMDFMHERMGRFGYGVDKHE
jgi:Spy/CpxP family protein refolding chaperone